MNLKLETKTWNWNLKLKLEIETWNWNMHNLKNVIGYYWVWGSNWFLGPTNVYNKFGFWKYSPIFCLNLATIGVFLPFFCTLQGYFWGWGQVQTLFCNIPIQTINFGFGSTALSFALIRPYLGPLFGPFGAFFWPFGFIFLGRGQVQKQF